MPAGDHRDDGHQRRASGVGDLPETGRAVPEYRGLPGRTDEYLGPDGAVRARWKQVAAEMAGLGPSGLVARRSEMARLLRNEGATYNVTRDSQSRRRPWSLDPWPLVVEESEWSALESAVAQRVRLLDLVFADLYGDRRLVAAGPCPRRAGPRPPGLPAGLRRHRTRPAPRRLFLTAVDVVRDADGRVPGHRGPGPGALGTRLRPGQPHHPVPGPAQPPPRVGGGAAGRVLPGHPGRRGLGRPRRGRRAPGGHPHPGPAERDLLRARLPGLLPRLRPGRGAGPGGQQQPGLAADRWPGSTRSTWSSAGWTTSGATRSSCGPTRCWACPACWRWPAGAG